MAFTMNDIAEKKEENVIDISDMLLGINDALDKAEEDDTPYAAIMDGKVNVVGDANKTELTKHDFTVSFRFPNGVIPAEAADVVGDGWMVKRVTFHDIFISPRRDIAVVNAATNLLPFFRQIQEDGSVRKLTKDELLMIGASLSDEAFDAMYMLVMRVLDIDDSLAPYITAMSILRNTMEIFEAFPSLASEAESFFE